MGESVLTSRERVLALVATQPGLHLRELPRRLGLSLRSVRYHLDTLVEAQLVTAHRSGRFERWFVTGSFSTEDHALISALRVGAQRKILTLLLHEGPMRFGAIERATALASATMVQSLGRLNAEGLVELGDDRLYRLCDRGAVQMRLDLYRQRFPDLMADAAREIFGESP
jgi:predicted transcriptional regulator